MQSVEFRILTEGFHEDPRTGWSAYPFILGGSGLPGTDVKGMHVVSIYPGQVRGNHYHAHTNEYLFIFTGRGMFYWEEEGALKERELNGEPVLVVIPPGIRHAFRNTGDIPVYLLAVRDGEFDYGNPDIVRVPLV